MARRVIAVEGLDRAYIALLRQRDAFATEKIQNQLMLAAQDLALGPQESAPRKTGRLQQSIVAKPSAKRPGAFVAVDRKVAFYARFLERGTAKMPARPFFRPGITAARPRALRLLREGLKGLSEQAAAKK